MRLYRTKDFPTELSVARDYLSRAIAASVGDHVVHVFNLEQDKISFARNTPMHLFSGDAIRKSNLYVDRHSLGGAAFYCGTEDAVCCFHINREALIDPNIPATEIFRSCADIIRDTIASFGIGAFVRSDREHNVRDGVCINLEGRSEVVTEDNVKLAGGVYRDDGLIVTAYEVILVSDAWTKIYDYMDVKPSKAKATSLQSLIPGITTDEVIDAICEQIGDYQEANFSPMDLRSMRRLAPKFGYDRWQD